MLGKWWSQVVLIHQIDSNLYLRQKENPKLANFEEKNVYFSKRIGKRYVERFLYI